MQSLLVDYPDLIAFILNWYNFTSKGLKAEKNNLHKNPENHTTVRKLFTKSVNKLRTQHYLLMKTQTKFLVLVLFVVFNACTTKKSKSNIDVPFTQDTLNVGYTYWWSQSGPFIGNCGEELSLVFSGTVTQLMNATDDAGPLYTPQEGVVEIDEVFKIKNLGEKNYANQKFFSADVFHELDLSVGDQVLVICYDYEGEYIIPGKQSILKIASFDDPLIESIRTYIDSDQDPLSIKKDLELWSEHGLKSQLNAILECNHVISASNEAPN